MPANWLGQRLAILFRRLVMRRLGEGCIDTTLWGMRLRLYPRRNGCEKNALFTPQMYDTMERRVLAEAVRGKQRRRVHVRRYRGECRALFALSRHMRERSHARDRAAARHSRALALSSRREPLCEDRRAADRAVRSCRRGRSGDQRQRQRRHAHRQAGRTAEPRRAHHRAEQAADCGVGGRRNRDRRCPEDRRGGRRGHRAWRRSCAMRRNRCCRA